MQDIFPAVYMKMIHGSGSSPVYFLGLKGIHEVFAELLPCIYLWAGLW